MVTFIATYRWRLELPCLTSWTCSFGWHKQGRKAYQTPMRMLKFWSMSQRVSVKEKVIFNVVLVSFSSSGWLNIIFQFKSHEISCTYISIPLEIPPLQFAEIQTPSSPTLEFCWTMYKSKSIINYVYNILWETSDIFILSLMNPELWLLFSLIWFINFNIVSSDERCELCFSLAPCYPVD